MLLEVDTTDLFIDEITPATPAQSSYTFTPKGLWNNRKAPISSYTTGQVERRSGQAHGQSEARGCGRRADELRGNLHINDLLDFYLGLLFPAAKKIQHPNHPHNPITPKSSASESTIAITENAKITR